METLTVDGVEVSVERGTTILEAAQKAGVRIPTLCHDKRLVPYGSCRLCMVEVTARGRTRTMPACFNPAREGMEVVTNSPKLDKSRRMQLMLLLRSHPLLCPSCDAAGACHLQNLVREFELSEPPFSRESRYFHVDNASHFIRFNMNLCIKCGMCVRICDEVQGENELSFTNRGMNAEVSTDFGRPLNCEFCGQCASICPVGAITSKWLVGTGREFELNKTTTTCSFCSLGCTLSLGQKADKVVYVKSSADSHNEGNLCVKGRYGWPYIYSEQRLVNPLIRKNGTLQEVGWNEALSFVAEGFNSIKNKFGSTSLAALGSERLTNEDAFVFNRFVRTVMGTPHLDHAGGFTYKALLEAVEPALGYPAGTNAIGEIRNAEVILLLAADLNETHPVAKNEVIVAASKHKAQIIIVDSITTKLARRVGSLHLRCAPGSEHLIANAILKLIIDQGLFDKTSLALKADGLDELTASLADFSVENVSSLSGVDADLIRQAAKMYADAEKATIILTFGMNRLTGDTESAKAAVNLALLTGRIGKESCGVHLFGEKANAQGAIDMGLAPGLLPGFYRISDETARKKFETVWGASIPSEKGLDALQILDKAESGEIRGLYVVGENPMETYPERTKTEKALGNLEFLVVQDLFLTSTAKMAHAVLPVSSFAEKIGTYTSAERLVQRIRPVLHSAKGKADMEIFTALAALMGSPSMTYGGPEQVMNEIADLIDVYRGISYDRLTEKGIPWPCVDAEDPGNSILYEGGFPGGKAHFVPAAPPGSLSKDGLPMRLVPGILKFHSGSFSEWSPSLMEVSPEGFAEMNSEDMKELGLQEEETVKITSRDGTAIHVRVKKSYRAPRRTVIVPEHFSQIKLNILTQRRQPVVNVRVEKA